MKRKCPKTLCQSSRIIRYGFFHRKSDGKNIRVFKCTACKAKFSAATGKPEFGQNKRRLNPILLKLFCSGVSKNRMAKNLKISPTTVERKLLFLSGVCRAKNEALLRKIPKCREVQFDELETYEHTKCKPLSVAVAVEKRHRLILGLEVSQMPCKGRLAGKSRQRYGPRKDRRLWGLRSLFGRIRPLLAEGVELRSDLCPSYAPMVRRMLKGMAYRHEQVAGGRGCSTGQGELKKLVFDPLFSLNHTFAMLRYGVSRLIRRTWCTTKKTENLWHHLQIYAYCHNLHNLWGAAWGIGPCGGSSGVPCPAPG